MSDREGGKKKEDVKGGMEERRERGKEENEVAGRYKRRGKEGKMLTRWNKERKN